MIIVALSGCSKSDEEVKIGAVEHFHRGNEYQENRQYRLAVEAYKMAIAEDSEQEFFYYNLGLSYYNLRLYELSVASYRKAIALRPDFPEAWYNMALALDKINKVEEAFIAYEKYQKHKKQQ